MSSPLNDHVCDCSKASFSCRCIAKSKIQPRHRTDTSQGSSRPTIVDLRAQATKINNRDRAVSVLFFPGLAKLL